MEINQQWGPQSRRKKQVRLYFWGFRKDLVQINRKEREEFRKERKASYLQLIHVNRYFYVSNLNPIYVDADFSSAETLAGPNQSQKLLHLLF